MMCSDISAPVASEMFKLVAAAVPVLADALEERDYPTPRFMRESLQEARVLGLFCNALMLCTAKEHLALQSDGTADKDQVKGLQEFLAYVAEITDRHGNPRSVHIDGFLKSVGLTSEKELKCCKMIMGIMKEMVVEAKALFAKKYPGLVATAPFLGAATDPERVGRAQFKIFKADGAASAQKWARLMGEWKVSELDRMLTQEQRAAMKPEEEAALYWFVTLNCIMHDLNLGAKHADKGE